MEFTKEQELKIVKLLALDFDEILLAVEIARDEAVRVLLSRWYSKDVNDVSPLRRKEHNYAKTINRKMYQHHANGKIYPWKIKDMLEGVITKEQLEEYFDNIKDPAPGSMWSRPIGT